MISEWIATAESGRQLDKNFSFLYSWGIWLSNSFICASLLPEVKIDFRVILPFFNFYSSSLLERRTLSNPPFIFSIDLRDYMACRRALASLIS
jgi:hypothetical protein